MNGDDIFYFDYIPVINSKKYYCQYRGDRAGTLRKNQNKQLTVYRQPDSI
jgi:hypothetical protein